ncbi:MAG: cytochrome c3 family protein [Candidatus Latescibacteria bacterium]|nr:cytochrome c3 family protein [Candidatus Latescibacterota bacterium]
MIIILCVLQFCFFLGAVGVAAQKNSECLDCHSDETLETTREGNRVSVYVDEKKLATSVHAGLSCVSCHADLREIPHEEPPQKVNCGICHAQEHALYNTSLHGKAFVRGDELAPSCLTCHGAHDILPVNDPTSPITPLHIPLLCGKCHREGAPVQLQREIHQANILENYSESIHGEGLLKKGLVVAATCASCHTAHQILPHTDPRSSIARKNIATTCAQCHAQIEQVHRKVIRGELWEKEVNVLPACVDCHQPHKVRKVFYDQGMADRDCLMCHGRENLKARDGRSLYVNTEELSVSRHVRVACSQCHSSVNPSYRRPCEGITSHVDCSTCHAEMAEQYQQSIHGQLFAKNDSNAPSCLECHGTHGIRGKRDPTSVTFPTNVPDLCARCHREGQKAAVRYTGKEHEITRRYAESIHGKGLLKSGLVVTAMCTDCHTAHRELPRNNPESSVYRNNVPATCGRCHHGIQEQFVRSVHSPGMTRGKDLPICSDCHTAHTIRRTDEVGFKLEIMNMCGRCHGAITKTYFETYHGKVSQLGYGKTAKCYDCHGAHDILPVEDPRSYLSRDNVVTTCRKCHPGSTRRFAGYLTHATHHDPDKYPWLFWTFWGMTVLLISVFVLGGLHTLLWLPRAIQMRRAHLSMGADPNEKQFVRFSRLNRVLHIVMIISFMSLALTGMTLKFSYTGWAATLSRLLGGFESAGYIHRVAAVMMISIFCTHLFDLVHRKRTQYGTWRALLFGPDTILPTRKDIEDFWGSIVWFLGLGDRPRYGRWTYWEKFDYFAVFWGIAVIGSTGLFLWFSEFFTRLIPGWFLNVATIIHSDEALLAVGFIFTIHFFNTHLRPEKFPMDIVIFTGRMSLEELKRDKPLEYEAMVQSGKLEDHVAEPYQPIVIKTIRVFAWTALAVGFSMVVWIIYAMLFAYR